MYDLLLKKAKIFDGTDTPWFAADVLIKNDKIVGVGEYVARQAQQVIDADGLYVMPGFIDSHTHADFHPLVEPTLKNWLMQGVTTIVNGNCGDSAAPYSATSPRLNWLDPFSRDYPVTWTNMSSYFRELAQKDLYINIAALVGHGRLRNEIMGFAPGPPNRNEANQMKELLAASLVSGAIGLSVGLTYAPGSFAASEELIQLATVVAEHGGIFVAHMRGNTLEGIKEVIKIGAETGVSLHVSHLKYRPTVLTLINEARENGVDLTFDLYPYNAGCTALVGILPKWVFADGGEDSVADTLGKPETRARLKSEHEARIWSLASYNWDDFILISAGNKNIITKSIGELARNDTKHPIDYICDLLRLEGLGAMIVVFFGTMDEVEELRQNELQMLGSDGIEMPPELGTVHPRTYGSFAKVLADVVHKDLLLPRVIRKMTSFTALRFGLKDRGLIAVGKKADLVVIDPATFKDNATYGAPRKHPSGIKWVIVNGRISVKDEKIVGSGVGRVIKSKNGGI